MMKDRVRAVKFEKGLTLDCSLLKNYDGQGLCDTIRVYIWTWEWEDPNPNNLEIRYYFDAWAENVGWTDIGTEDEGIHITYKRL